MFWRKTRAAIGGFHPLHQALIWQHGASATLPPAEWAAFVASLSQHAAVVRRRKWRLPDRTTVLAPLIGILAEDVAPGGLIGVTADLRGPKAPGKEGPEQDLPVRHPIRTMTQWFAIDPWLQVRAELRDGSVLELAVTDRVRYRRIRKVNPRGKVKIKTKTKTVRRISARRTLARGQTARRPDTPPPRWVAVRGKEGKRMVLNATAKTLVTSGASAPQDDLQPMLTVVTELFRWTPPASERRTA